MLMTESDREYHLQRAREERGHALASTNEAARAAHDRLGQLHAARACYGNGVVVPIRAEPPEVDRLIGLSMQRGEKSVVG
jgi:hypothetical protein